MPRLHRHAELEELPLPFEHAGEHPLGDRSEILVLELLPLRRLGAEERPAGNDEVGTGKEEIPVDEEIFLLRSGRRRYLADVLVAKHREHAAGLLVDGLHRPQERRLLVERLARPRTEGGRDAERGAVGIVEDVGRAGRIPRGVPAGFEGGPEAAGREARSVGLALTQFLARKLGHRMAVARRREKGVVLLGGDAGERVEDVGVVGGALLDRPVLHCQGHRVGDARIKRLALLDGGLQRLVDTLRQPVLHRRVTEHVGAEDLTGGRLAEVPRLPV